MQSLLRSPKIQLSLFLFAILLSAIVSIHSLLPFRNFLIILSTAIIVDLSCVKLRGIKPFFPSAAIATACIIALLASPTLSIVELIATTLTAMVIKNFLRIKNRHIFNPAASGLFLVSLLFHHTVSWWGVSFQTIVAFRFQSLIFLLILFSPFLVSAVRMRRFRIQVPFLTVNTILAIFFSHQPAILTLLFDPTTIFFTAVMLPEPMTTPNRPSQQLAFGAFIAILATILSLPSLIETLPFLQQLPDVFLLSLLISNLLFFVKR